MHAMKYREGADICFPTTIATTITFRSIRVDRHVPNLTCQTRSSRQDTLVEDNSGANPSGNANIQYIVAIARRTEITLGERRHVGFVVYINGDLKFLLHP